MQRAAYHRQLLDLARQVVTLGSAVLDNVGRATEALTRYDVGLVDDVVAADDTIDEIAKELERSAIRVLALESPVASELQYVVSLIRLVYELERCGDLMVNVAKSVHRLDGPIDDDQVRIHLERLADQSRLIFEKALRVYASGEATDLHDDDDAVDLAHMALLKVLADPDIPHRTIIALTIAGRCFERVGDHAVNLADRSSLLADAALTA